MEYLLEDETKEFINRLPDLTTDPTTVHLIMLAVRSRKAKQFMGIKIRDLLVERKVIRPVPNWRQRYLDRVYNQSVLQHHGRYHFDDRLVPPEAMANYVTLSPRNVAKATIELMKDNLGLYYQGNEEAYQQLAKQTSKYFGALHKYKDRSTNFVTLDIDVDDRNLYDEVLDFVTPLPIFMATRTCRGYHIVLDLIKKDDARAFYAEGRMLHKLRLKYSKEVEVQRDSQEPVPGTLYYREKGKLNYVRILQ